MICCASQVLLATHQYVRRKPDFCIGQQLQNRKTEGNKKLDSRCMHQHNRARMSPDIMNSAPCLRQPREADADGCCCKAISALRPITCYVRTASNWAEADRSGAAFRHFRHSYPLKTSAATTATFSKLRINTHDLRSTDCRHVNCVDSPTTSILVALHMKCNLATDSRLNPGVPVAQFSCRLK